MKFFVFPLVRLFIPFFIGIVAGIYFSVQSPYFNFLLLLVFLVLLVISWPKTFKINYKNRWLFGFIANLFLLLVGYQLAIYRTDINHSNHFSKSLTEESYEIILGEVIKDPVFKEKTMQLVLEVNAIRKADSLVKKNGKLMMYVAKSSRSSKLEMGDLIVLESQIHPIQSLPDSDFDYARYLRYRSIYHRGYAADDSWKKLKSRNTQSWKLKAEKLRKQLLLYLKNNGLVGASYSIGSALLMGEKGGLEPELSQSFSKAGVMHVLAVSGLHVGILFLVFNAALFFFDKISNGVLIKSLLIVLLLWGYAVLTGMSPSVVRAVTMFSFVALGKAFKRESFLLNTLFLSLFCLLLVDPYMLCSVGFQLSYAAVFGIAIVYPWLYKKLVLDNWVLDKSWAIVCVSIAAQFSTFPLGIYYFHEFPTYFLISNILVIPTVTLALIIGLSAVLTIPFAALSTLLVKLFSMIIGVLIVIAQSIESLPYSSIEEIYINEIQLGMLITAVLLFFGFVQIKKSKNVTSNLLS